MQRMMVKLFSIILLSVLIAVSVAGCATREKTATRHQVTVTDIIGRQVSVVVPAERVVLAMARDLHMFAAVAGEETLKKIVGWGPDLKLWDQDTYLKYEEKFPEIEAIPDVGYHYNGNFSVERVISLKPDVVIFPKWIADIEGGADDMAKLEQVGIPSIVIDYSSNPWENAVPSTILLGTVLGEEKRAREIVDFYETRVNAVVARLQKIDKPKPKVYVELGSKGPSEYGNTSGNISWGAMVLKAGGNNIAEGVVKGTTPINPEYLLKENADVIIIAGSNWKTPGAMRLGYYASPEESRGLLKAFTERPGWNTLRAVQNGRVYSVFSPWHAQIQHFAAIEALAKWFYPDEFKDLDPEGSFKEFHDRFLPVDYSGVWMIGIKD